MIRTIKLDINAAYPNMPLEPVNVFSGSAASFTICNVPRAVGERAITSVALEFKTRGGTSQTLQAVRVGSAYEVTIPASSLPLPYSAALGVKVIGIGTDENKSSATWVIGVADLIVLNNQGQVTPGADAGDVKHSEFSDLDPDTTPLAVVIERLKGSAMSLALAITVLIVNFTSFAALPVTPAYTNNNRFAGLVMTNMQQWASAVESAIGQGVSGGADTNAVNDLIRAYDATNLTARLAAKVGTDAATNISQRVVREDVRTNFLCTVAAAQAMTNDAVSVSTNSVKTYADGRFLTSRSSFDSSSYGYALWNGRDFYLNGFSDGQDQGSIHFDLRTGDINLSTFGNLKSGGYGLTDKFYDKTTTDGLLSGKMNVNSAYSKEDTNTVATNAAVAVVSPVSNRVDYLDGYIAGQRVRVCVTNYYGNTSGQFPRLRIEEFITATNVVDGVSTGTNYWQIVWDEQNKYDLFLQEARTAVAAMTNNLYQTYYQLLQERLATKAPRAWGTLTSAGEAAPPGSVWHTEPNTVFAGGTEYAHAMVGTGVIGVLTTKGAAVYTDGEPGRFHFTTDDRQYHFGINIASRYEIGCATDGISVTPVGGDNMVDLTYNITMTGKPILYYTPSLTQPITWEQITDSTGGAISGATVYASWDQSPPAGSEICTINCGAALSGFFKASVEYAGVSKFETNMMSDLAGGIVATNQTSGHSQPVEPYIVNGSVMWRVKQ